MKIFKWVITIVILCIAQLSFGQISLTISNPSLTMPYQVASGTQVTFEWSAMGTPPTMMYSGSVAPTIQQNLPPNSSWTQHSNFVNGTNTTSLTLTVNNDIWVWGGVGGFIGWQYSNVVAVQAISSMVISSSDSLICPTNGSVILTAPSGTGYSYQWYQDTVAISGATSITHNATVAANYHCVINGTNVSNTISLGYYEASFTGSYANNAVTMTADQSFSSYQWFSRTSSGAATPISGANSAIYTANVTGTATHYSLQGTTASGCVVTSADRTIASNLFQVPVITLQSTPNTQGYLCEGSPTMITSTGVDSMLIWYKNGSQSFSLTDTVNLSSSYHNGNWHVESTILGWPEISLISNTVNVAFVNIITPNITGGNFNTPYCAGDAITMILTDEGYTYSWYKHDSLNNYNSTNQISVPTGVYQTTFNGDTMVTIEAEYNGCFETNTITLTGWGNQTISTTLSNWDQQYLCTDSSNTISVANWQVSNYTNFQWHELLNGVWVTIANATNSSYLVSNPGKYKVSANPTACATATAFSDTITIHSYLDRAPSIYTLQQTICQGEETTLRLSGSSSWYAKQWLSADIVLGQGGYARSFVGMINNSAADTQLVDEYGGYQMSAKHISCPNGLKVKSNVVFIQPTNNPQINLVTPMATEPKHVIAWDSVDHYIGCMNEPVTMTLNDTSFNSIVWYVQSYMGDDDYALGASMGAGAFADTAMDARFVTAVVTDANGCKGQSTPVLLDARVFQLPAVASSNNSELCNPGDSVLLHLGFPGTWSKFEWLVDGVLIPNSDNDSIWAKDEGEYVIVGYPADCPNMPHSSGIGPVVKYLYADILENDSLIYAMPELGFYSYQWFFNGDSIAPSDPTRPWVYRKDSLQNGVYTVAVSNQNCTKISPDYVWETTGIGDVNGKVISLFPNPTTGMVTISGLNTTQNYQVSVVNLNGTVVYRTAISGGAPLHLEGLTKGVYAIQLADANGYTTVLKCIVE